MDNKYGKLYTRDDVSAIVEQCMEADIESLSEAWEYINAYEGKLSGDMPVFVLLAKDRRALGAVRFYRDNQSKGAPPAHLMLIDTTLAGFEQWRNDNPELMKEPD